MPERLSSRASIFEEVLRSLSPRGFDAVVRSGVRDLSSFLALDPQSIPGTSPAVRTAICQLQAATTERVEAEGAQHVAASRCPAKLDEPAEMAVRPDEQELITARRASQVSPEVTVWAGGVPKWSVLRCTLLDLLGVDHLTRDSIWSTASGTGLSELRLTDADWRRLRAAGIPQDDHCSCLLSLSIEYLLRLRIGAAAFGSLVALVSKLLGACSSDDAFGWRSAVSERAVVEKDRLVNLCGLRLDCFDIPADILQRMRDIEVLTWGDLAEVSERSVLVASSTGLAAFLRVNDLWWLRDYADKALSVVSPLQIGQDDGFSSMVATLLSVASRRPSDDIVFLGRMGLLDERLWTLQELGERLDITRERVRQIEQKMRLRLEAPRHRKRLDAFRLAVSQVLRTSGGVCTYEEAGRGLCELLRWGTAPPAQALGRFMASFGICDCDRGQEIACDPFHRCLNCRLGRETLGTLLGDRDVEKPIAELAAGISQRCEAANECGCRQDVPHFSHGYVRRLLSDDGRFFVDNDTVYSRDTWRLRNGSRLQIVENILRSEGRPMHFRDVYAQVCEQLPGETACTPRNVHAWLSRADAVLLWDRGTFVYAEAVEVPKLLMRRIEEWLVDRLSEGVPFMCVTGAFAQFHKACLEDGVSSETALYTCLRRSGNPHLVYPRYPQVYLADSFESRIPALVALEQYVRDAGREVSMRDLTEYALSELCLKDFQFQQCVGQMSGILRTGTGGFVDMSLVPVDSARLERLKDEMLRMVEREGHIAVTRVFDEKRVSCRMMGVGSPEMLYSLLRECDFDELDLRSYPQISLANRKRRSGESKGVVAEIVSYIRHKGAPVSFDELEDRYVDDLGYNERTVHAAALARLVLRYGQGSVVHAEAIAWSDEKQALLERAALAELQTSRESGWVHGLASRLLECGELPDLAGSISWTQTLVCELLTFGKRFRVLGNGRNAFVTIPNEDGIQSLDDIVARTLRLEFDGASELATIEERLRELGVIKRRLTGAMLGEGAKVVVTEHLILMRELFDRAE